jgi:hypothetical protein
MFEKPEGFDDKYAAIATTRDILEDLFDRDVITEDEKVRKQEDLDEIENDLDAQSAAGELTSTILELDDAEAETLADAVEKLHARNVEAAASKDALDQLFRIIRDARGG